MLCSEFEERFHSLLDDRCNPEEDSVLANHAAQCPACRESLNSWDLLSVGLEAWEPPPSTASIDNIVAMALATKPEASTEVVQPKTPTPRSYDVSSVVAPILLSAAVLAIAFFVPTFMANNGQAPIGPDNNRNELANVATKPSDRVEHVAENNNPQPSEAEVVRGRELLNQMRSRIPETTDLGTIATDLSRENLPNGLQPIAGSFEVALNAFRKTLPGKKGFNIIPGKPQASKLAAPNFA